jgi:hypothetical protein
VAAERAPNACTLRDRRQQGSYSCLNLLETTSMRGRWSCYAYSTTALH